MEKQLAQLRITGLMHDVVREPERSRLGSEALKSLIVEEARAAEAPDELPRAKKSTKCPMDAHLKGRKYPVVDCVGQWWINSDMMWTTGCGVCEATAEGRDGRQFSRCRQDQKICQESQTYCFTSWGGSTMVESVVGPCGNVECVQRLAVWYHASLW